MGNAVYVIKDATETRVIFNGGPSDINYICVALMKNPQTHQELHQHYSALRGEELYVEGNRPKIPEELSLDEIRRVMGWNLGGDEEVLSNWKRASGFFDPNYERFARNEKTKYDLPTLKEAAKDWKNEDPDREEYRNVREYRRFTCRRTYHIDLHTKTLTYCDEEVLARNNFWEELKENKIKKYRYRLPKEWKMVRK